MAWRDIARCTASHQPSLNMHLSPPTQSCNVLNLQSEARPAHIGGGVRLMRERARERAGSRALMEWRERYGHCNVPQKPEVRRIKPPHPETPE
eukprot:2136087-Rhodomonas_salina.1